MTRWVILTGEYPPQPGGVADYTRLVARGLAAAGDAVRVFAPPAPAECGDSGVTVRRLPGRFGPRSLAALDHQLRRLRPDRILVQYVPHAFGWRAMNLPFAAWLAARARRAAPVWVMFHEVAFRFAWRPLRHAALGVATRAMARLAAGAADRVFVSIPAWGDWLERICPRVRSPEWLPVPCTIDAEADPGAIAAVRSQFPADVPVVGHFGTFGAHVAGLLAPAVAELFRLVPAARVRLIGRGSEAFAAAHAGWGDHMTATGELPAAAVAAHLRACDVLLQPFPDGVSSRRTSAMAAVANGVPLVTNLGELSEPLWAGGTVAAVPAPDPAAMARAAAALLADSAARAELGRRGAELYRAALGPGHTVAKLREVR